MRPRKARWLRKIGLPAQFLIPALNATTGAEDYPFGAQPFRLQDYDCSRAAVNAAITRNHSAVKFPGRFLLYL
jgi:hypothetical protein